MSSTIPEITVAEFKEYFEYDFKYLIIYNSSESYDKDITVYSQDSKEFYLSQINNNDKPLSDETSWKLIENESLVNYISDKQIEKAMFQARSILPYRLFKKDESELLKMCYLYLTAYYLVVDNNLLSNKSSSGMIGSKSVDGVSVSYNYPDVYMKNPLFFQLTKNGYGEKYLSYIIPRLSGRIYCVKGTTSLL